ncbi:DUF402 domain-containing protein [Traorella massiliensis]|uniref:DUF402 domain-containing protein n=1 Tax=Traorella massiliensis TaxID=1903263 RepID=UPI0008F911DF|nr:DUF402 domain-containing protein [Traorella massiliensis]
MLPKVKESIYIQSFKHDGSLHRTWAKGYVMEANEKRIVCVTNKTWVSESDGRRWVTREPAIYFFYPDKWFNVISMIRKTGIYYYCNIASPSIYDGESLKNIDYDLDLKVNPQYGWTILDEDEYVEHGIEMGYSEELKKAIEKGLDQVIELVADRKSPFDHDEVSAIYERYLEETQR